MKLLSLFFFILISSLSAYACEWSDVKQSAEQTAAGFCANSNGVSETFVSLASVVRGDMLESQMFVTCNDGTKLIGSIDYNLNSASCLVAVSLGPVAPL
jgi:hypothetical protein